MLKRKLEANYRKAIGKKDGRMRRCHFCAHIEWTKIRAIGGEHMHNDYRCEFIGLENSRRYAIKRDYICDHFEGRKG